MLVQKSTLHLVHIYPSLTDKRGVAWAQGYIGEVKNMTYNYYQTSTQIILTANTRCLKTLNHVITKLLAWNLSRIHLTALPLMNIP